MTSLKKALEIIDSRDLDVIMSRRLYHDISGGSLKGVGGGHTTKIDLIYWMRFIQKRLDEGKIPVWVTIISDSENNEIVREYGVYAT